jgi:hypothetical protein
MREKLETKYHKEREDICYRLIHILELDANHSILLNKLENDIEKQTKIMDMKDEIQKYFAVSCLSPYKPNATCKRPYINILRGILRKQGYTFEGFIVILSLNEGKYTSTTRYRIFRNK